MDEHHHRVVGAENAGADHQHPDAPAADHVVADVSAGHHVASTSASIAASSPSRDACQALAAMMLRRSRYSRIASETNADRLPPPTAELSACARSSSRVMEIAAVMPATLPMIVLGMA